MKQETILEKRRRQSDRIRQMTVAAMLSAITALLVFTPIGMIQLPPPLLAVTTVHVPVLIAALVGRRLCRIGVRHLQSHSSI